jgi:hypothetical protein
MIWIEIANIVTQTATDGKVKEGSLNSRELLQYRLEFSYWQL